MHSLGSWKIEEQTKYLLHQHDDEVEDTREWCCYKEKGVYLCTSCNEVAPSEIEDLMLLIGGFVHIDYDDSLSKWVR